MTIKQRLTFVLDGFINMSLGGNNCLDELITKWSAVNASVVSGICKDVSGILKYVLLLL